VPSRAEFTERIPESRRRQLIRRLIFKSSGSIHISRMLEWPIILNWLDLQKRDKICDVACGGGSLALRIARRGYEVHGIDISESQINDANTLSNLENIECTFVVANAEHLPYSSGYFDKVISSCSLEHFQDDIAALKEMNRILKPGGCLVLTVDSLSYPGMKNRTREAHRKRASVVNYYDHEELKKQLETAGFDLVYYKYYLNSFVSNLFFELGIKLGWSGILYAGLSVIGYTVCLLSDRIFGSIDRGNGLAVKAKKVKGAPG